VFILTYFADAFLSGVEEAQRRAFLHIALAGCLLVVLSFAPEIRRRLSGRSRQANGSPEAARVTTFTDATSAEGGGKPDAVATSPQEPASPGIGSASPASRPDRNGSRRGSPAREDAQRT
jgi:hypothetical protein